jgi:hypothetical protein
MLCRVEYQGCGAGIAGDTAPSRPCRTRSSPEALSGRRWNIFRDAGGIWAKQSQGRVNGALAERRGDAPEGTRPTQLTRPRCRAEVRTCESSRHFGGTDASGSSSQSDREGNGTWRENQKILIRTLYPKRRHPNFLRKTPTDRISLHQVLKVRTYGRQVPILRPAARPGRRTITLRNGLDEHGRPRRRPGQFLPVTQPGHNNSIIINGTAESASRYSPNIGDEEQNAERNCVRIDRRSRCRFGNRVVRSPISAGLPPGGEHEDPTMT